MNTTLKWIVVRVDGKIAAISSDYRQLARISSHIVRKTSEKTGSNSIRAVPYHEITARTVPWDEIWRLRKETEWNDLLLFGTDFQKKVWKKIWELTHPSAAPAEADIHQNTNGPASRLISYSDFAELCQNRSGVRAVAHAIGLNPVAVIIPCHLIVPKESIDKIRRINKKAEATIFKGDDLCINSILSDSSIDFGEYSYGRNLKRELIIKELTGF